MISYLKRISNVNSFNARTKKCISADTLINIESQNVLEKVKHSQEIVSNGLFYVVLDNLRRPIYSNIESKLLNNDCDFRIRWINNSYIGFYKKGDLKTNGVIDIDNDKILFETLDNLGRCPYNNYLMGDVQGRIFSNNLYNGTLLWQLDISQLGRYTPFFEDEERAGEVRQFVGVYQGQLIVLLSGGKFIGVDIATGTLLWEQHKVAVNHTQQKIDYAFGDPYHPFLDEAKGLIYILQGENFIVFDIKAQIASYEWSIKDLSESAYLFIRQSSLYNNQIYFTAFKKGNEGNDDTVGIFDIEHKQIVWQYTFPFEKGTFIPNSQSNVQVNETHLYVLDSSGDLNIFEREEK